MLLVVGSTGDFGGFEAKLSDADGDGGGDRDGAADQGGSEGKAACFLVVEQVSGDGVCKRGWFERREGRGPVRVLDDIVESFDILRFRSHVNLGFARVGHEVDLDLCDLPRFES